VSQPYTLADARRILGEVAGDPAFADDFFARYVEGHEIVDYRRLLARAGLVLRPRHPARAWLGSAEFSFSGDGASLTGPSIAGTPIYEAGLDAGDVLMLLDRDEVTSRAGLEEILEQRKVGDHVRATFRRLGRVQKATIVLAADPRLELIPIERTGQPLGDAERRFRQSWLGGK
jgi:predicted metalloprotease with PDZ domain